MRKGENYNHPKKGSSIKVAPITKTKDIKAIKRILAYNPRNLCLFTIGINTNLRASVLVKLKVGQARYLKPMEEIELKETKTRKMRRISFNKTCINSIQNLLKHGPERPDNSYLFESQRGGPLTVSSVTRLVKQWCDSINLKGNYGSHTMRKTFGYQQRTRFSVGLPELMVTFGHASQQQTLEYLCIQPEEVRLIYANEI
jgi:integrase